MNRRRSWTAVACWLVAVAACDGSSGQSEDAGAHPSDVLVVDGYPAGPFGVVAGETIENLGFYDPDTKETVHLARWFQHPKTRVIMLVSTAAW